MAFALDSLGYAKHLRMLVYRYIRRRRMPKPRGNLSWPSWRRVTILACSENDLDTVRRELETKIDAMRRELDAKIDTLSMRLTIRMGVMIAAGVAALAAIIKL